MSTGADFSARAARRPPKPPPMITTFRAMHCTGSKACAAAPGKPGPKRTSVRREEVLDDQVLLACTRVGKSEHGLHGLGWRGDHWPGRCTGQAGMELRMLALLSTTLAAVACRKS